MFLQYLEQFRGFFQALEPSACCPSSKAATSLLIESAPFGAFVSKDSKAMK